MKTSGSKTAYRNSGGVLAGLIVIGIGTLFLLDNFGISFSFMEYHNWWALFILLGALGPLSFALRRFRTRGKLDGVVLHSLVSAAAIITIALMFLLDLSWNLWWPLFIIFGGLWMLANNWRRDAGATSS